MGADQPGGGFLWYLKADTWERRSECIQGKCSPLLLPKASELARPYSSAGQEKLFYPVGICRPSTRPCDKYGIFGPAVQSGQEGVRNTSQSSAGQTGNHITYRHPLAVSAYEDVVVVASSHCVYVTSIMCLRQKVKQRLNDTRLAEYVRSAVEDEKSEHVLALTEVSAVPKQIPLSEAVVSVACGAEHLLLSTSVGRVYSMGSNRHGQLGRGSPNSDFGRLGVVYLDGDIRSNDSEICSPAAVAVYAGSNFSFVIARRYRGTPTEKTTFTFSGCTARRVEGTILNAKPIAPTSCSTRNHISVTGQEGAESQSGSASPLAEPTLPRAASPTLLSPDQPPDLLDGGKGEVLYSWGCNDYGQLGHGTKETVFRPVVVARPSEVLSWGSVAAGFAHAVVLTGNHTVYSCGLNLHGQLGLGTTNEETSLSKIDLPERVQQISCGTWHTLFLTFSGQLLVAGRPPEFPYTGWLQSGPTTTDLMNVQGRHVGSDLKCGAGKEAFAVASYIPSQEDASISDGGNQPQTLTPHLQIKTEQPLRVPPVVTTSQSILLSTTRQLSRVSTDLDALLRSKSSLFTHSSETQSAANIPFAHAPGILCIKGFREDLKFISAGSTMNAAIGFSEQTESCRLYVWKAAEPREHAENWVFVSEVFDVSSLLQMLGGAKGANVACHCAASGVYVWTEPSQTYSNNHQF